MSKSNERRTLQPPDDVSVQSIVALLALWKTHLSHVEAQSLFQRALPIEILHDVGMTSSQIELLLRQGCLESAQWRQGQGAAAQATATGIPPCVSNAEFVLTPAGLEIVQRVSEAFADASSNGAVSLNGSASPRPRWNPASGELIYRNVVVKRFPKPALTQACVLEAFEEEDWPRRIDDPLPMKDGIPPAHRLHDTIKRLNRRIHPPLLRFGGDGTGAGVCWWPVGSPADRKR